MYWIYSTKSNLGKAKQILKSWFFSKVLFKENKSVLKNIIQDGEWCIWLLLNAFFIKSKIKDIAKTSKKITEQLGAGEDYRKLKPIIIIAILYYSFIESPEYVTETIRVAKDDRGYELNNDVKYYYIELEKFRKENPDMTRTINHWLSFLDMERGELLEMACEKNDKVKKAVENYEVLTGDEEVKRLSEIRLMSNLEEKSALHCAREEGREEGKKTWRRDWAKTRKKRDWTKVKRNCPKIKRTKNANKTNSRNNRTEWKRNRSIRKIV